MTVLAAYDPAVPQAAGLALGLVAGLVLGLVHFGALGRTVRYLVSGRALLAVVLQMGRFALAAGAFFGLAQIGSGSLLAGLAGLLLSRQILLRRFGGVP